MTKTTDETVTSHLIKCFISGQVFHELFLVEAACRNHRVGGCAKYGWPPWVIKKSYNAAKMNTPSAAKYLGSMPLLFAESSLLDCDKERSKRCSAVGDAHPSSWLGTRWDCFNPLFLIRKVLCWNPDELLRRHRAHIKTATKYMMTDNGILLSSKFQICNAGKPRWQSYRALISERSCHVTHSSQWLLMTRTPVKTRTRDILLLVWLVSQHSSTHPSLCLSLHHNASFRTNARHSSQLRNVSSGMVDFCCVSHELYAHEFFSTGENQSRK